MTAVSEQPDYANVNMQIKIAW